MSFDEAEGFVRWERWCRPRKRGTTWRWCERNAELVADKSGHDKANLHRLISSHRSVYNKYTLGYLCVTAAACVTRVLWQLARQRSNGDQLVVADLGQLVMGVTLYTFLLRVGSTRRDREGGSLPVPFQTVTGLILFSIATLTSS